MSHRLSGPRITHAVLAAAMAGALHVNAVHGQDCWKPDTQIGDFQFTMPEGWKRVEGRDITTLVPGDVAQGSVAHIGLLAAQPLNGDFRAWFDSKWTEWQQQFKAVDGYDPKSDRTAQGFELLRAYTRISSPALGFGTFVFAAVRVGTRAEAYYFVDTSGRWSYLETDLPNFEHSLRFADHSTPAHADDSTGVAGGLDGLYIGYRMRGATPFERTHFEYFVFFPDGTAIRFLPETGLEHFDFAAEAKKSPDYCGCYRVSGNRVTIRWGNNSTETGALSTGPEGTLKIRGDSYFPVATADGLALDGTYRFPGADLAPSFIRFSPDGHFEENGMLPLVASSLTAERQIDPAPGRGTYRIAKNTVTLLYNDRRTVPLSFFVWPDGPGQRPGAIHVNTYRLVRDP